MSASKSPEMGAGGSVAISHQPTARSEKIQYPLTGLDLFPQRLSEAIRKQEQAMAVGALAIGERSVSVSAQEVSCASAKEESVTKTLKSSLKKEKCPLEDIPRPPTPPRPRANEPETDLNVIGMTPMHNELNQVSSATVNCINMLTNSVTEAKIYNNTENSFCAIATVDAQ